MVVKMMKWRPWPPPSSKRYEVKLLVKKLEGWSNSDQVHQGADKDEDHHNHNQNNDNDGDMIKLTFEIRWKGTPNNNKVALMRRRSFKRDFTSDRSSNQIEQVGVFRWDEEFQRVCNLSTFKDNSNNCSPFHPWEIGFSLLHGSKPGPKNKASVLATASLNLAEYASMTEQKEFDLSIPVAVSGSVAYPCASLHIFLSLLELNTTQDSGDSLQRSIVPVSSPQLSEETLSSEKDELSALKAGLRKVKILTGYVASRRAKKACREEDGSEGRCSSRSEDGDYPFDSDSFDEFGEGEADEGKEDANVRKSFSYGTLAYANYMGGSFFSSTRVTSKDEDWIYYSHRKSDVGCSVNEDCTSSNSEPPLMQTSKRSILPWRKRKQIFRSPKAKGEPLLKKAYAEEGGDDIDFDRRQLSSDESISFGWLKSEDDLAANRPSISEFGDDSFAVGSWEQKEIVSRDGQMKLYADVFFASIDQRSERAAGESACTALVAVIADWFHNNRGIMPIKSQFDSLIRDGSLEWRKLCENETYRERFPDKHFDLETVLLAKIRPLSVHPGKSFIGFFHPEETVEGKFDFLQGAMSFDSIWDEVSRSNLECPSYGDPNVYIISWNDHFFILKVDPDAYYIIDTLGERLFEGCNQAYVLKFDRNTKIVKLPGNFQPSEEKPNVDQPVLGIGSEQKNEPVEPRADEPMKSEEEELICQGKEACKDYIKNFMAALPIRELLADLKKGLSSSPPLQRLQVEFHYTQFLSPPVTEASSAAEVVALTPNLLPREMEMAISEVAVA